MKISCFVCQKTVYPMELISINDKQLHKTCLRCTHCNGTLSLGKYASINGKFYCKPHFKQLFALKGNYSEGFQDPSAVKPTVVSHITSSNSELNMDIYADTNSSAGVDASLASSFNGVQSDKSRINGKQPDFASNTSTNHDNNGHSPAKQQQNLKIDPRRQSMQVTSQPTSAKYPKSPSASDFPPLGTSTKRDASTFDKESPLSSSNHGLDRADTQTTSSNESLVNPNVSVGRRISKSIESLQNSVSNSNFNPSPSKTVEPIHNDYASAVRKTVKTMSSTNIIGSAGTNSSTLGGNVKKCAICEKSVYPMEQILVETKVMHKTCLRCAHCNNVLKLGNYAALDGKYFCKPHFKQLFALKGNYNEGFGTRPHKEKWLEQPKA